MSISTIYAVCNDETACNDGATGNCMYVTGSHACSNTSESNFTCVDVQTCLDNATCNANIYLPQNPAPAPLRRKITTPVRITRTNDNTGTEGGYSTFASSGNTGFEEGIEIDFSDRTACSNGNTVELIGLNIAAGVTNGDNALFVASSSGSSITSLIVSGCELDGDSGSSQRTEGETFGIRTASNNVDLNYLEITNSTIKNFTKGIVYLGLGGGVTHIIGNSPNTGNIFEGNDVHISYPNFNISASAGFAAANNYWEGHVGLINEGDPALFEIGGLDNSSTYFFVTEIFQDSFGEWAMDNNFNNFIEPAMNVTIEDCTELTLGCPDPSAPDYDPDDYTLWGGNLPIEDCSGIIDETECEYSLGDDWGWAEVPACLWYGEAFGCSTSLDVCGRCYCTGDTPTNLDVCEIFTWYRVLFPDSCPDVGCDGVCNEGPYPDCNGNCPDNTAQGACDSVTTSECVDSCTSDDCGYTQEDDCGVCGGSNACAGCMDENACDYDSGFELSRPPISNKAGSPSFIKPT